MISRVFVDTNVFTYARDSRAPLKQLAAQAWLRALGDHRLGVASPQIVGEYLNVLARGKIDMERSARRSSAGLIELWSIGETDNDLVGRGWELHEATGFQFWDCVVIASAIEARCRCLLSEDYQRGRRRRRFDHHQSVQDVARRRAPPTLRPHHGL
jgi:predicted nucleic acid-binding protein